MILIKYNGQQILTLYQYFAFLKTLIPLRLNLYLISILKFICSKNLKLMLIIIHHLLNSTTSRITQKYHSQCPQFHIRTQQVPCQWQSSRILVNVVDKIWYLNKYCIIIKIRKMKSESSEDEGFYKPAIQITQPTPMLTTQFNSLTIQQQFDNAIDIITEDRPLDFVPRLLNSDIKYYTSHHQLQQLTVCASGEFMDPIAYNVKDNKEIKEKRYKSLQAKYKNNPDYQLVYSKIPQNSEFSSYIFSLQNTPDYNANDFTPISSQLLPDDTIFDSRFESGNLLYAYCKKNSQYVFPQYDLIMQNDTNTKGYSQWFYFTIRNREHKKIKLNIVNFTKKNLMFLDGVRPVAFFQKAFEKDKKGWAFVGDNCTYGKSFITREIAGNPPQFKNYYTFSFEINFSDRDDLVYIALNFPYTYSRMINHIQNLINTCPEQVQIQKQILCHTISNNPIPYLIIQHKSSPSQNKKTILCLARQHPGETVGSYVLEAFLNNLLSKSKLILEYKFVVVPMVNPDGVIYGNFRTNLAGFDLNRQWTEPNRWLHPEIFFLSRLIPLVGEIQFCMDFHGHSKKMNSFIYACFGQKINDFRLYPYILSQKCELFSLKDCTYNISMDKLKTARVNVFNEVKKPYIFTLQTSFFGHTKENKNQRFTLADFEAIGKGAVQGLQLLMIDKKALAKIEIEVKDKTYLFDQWAMQNRQDDGSESNPSEDQLNPIERKAKVMSDVKARKPVKKPLKRKGKKKEKSPNKKKKQISQYLLKQKADSALFLQDRKSQKKMPINIKSSESSGVIVIEDSKKKAKSEAKKQISQTYMQPKMRPPPPIIPRPQQIKTIGSKATKPEQKIKLNSTTNSNLFDTANYLKMREQVSMELKKVEEPKLQISCFSGKQQPPSVEKSSRFRQMQAEKMKKSLEELAPVYAQPKKKSMERVYIIKENKVVSSITRVNEEQMRRNIERQISSRTMALKNCQKIMSTFAIQKVSKSNIDSHEFVQQDPYKTRKLLRPLDIKRHRNFNGFRDEQRSGVFFSFLGN